MSDIILTDGVDTVTLRLEYKYISSYTINLIKYRGSTGKGYFLNNGSWKVIRLPVRYVDKVDKDLINSWSASKDTLTLTLEGEDTEVRIVNKSSPVSQLMPPYSYVYKGQLEMEML